MQLQEQEELNFTQMANTAAATKTEETGEETTFKNAKNTLKSR
jgi:hypothetical protein